MINTRRRTRKKLTEYYMHNLIIVLLKATKIFILIGIKLSPASGA